MYGEIGGACLLLPSRNFLVEAASCELLPMISSSAPFGCNFYDMCEEKNGEEVKK